MSEEINHGHKEHEKCDHCHGEGKHICDECHGKGKETCPECHGKKEVKCGKCNGRGNFSNCSKCGSTGRVDCEKCGGSVGSERNVHGAEVAARLKRQDFGIVVSATVRVLFIKIVGRDIGAQIANIIGMSIMISQKLVSIVLGRARKKSPIGILVPVVVEVEKKIIR